MSENSRFQHLLQPIRDLSQNWNIDLAQELEEYLDELEHLTIAFDANGEADGDADIDNAAAMDAEERAARVRALAASETASSSGGAQLMNFAEAALLIQGTSMIYSRKVEYLYALVFQTLSHLSKQNDPSALMQQHADGGANRRGRDADQDDEEEPEEDSYLDVFANPLPVVDTVEEARNINLKRTADKQQHARLDTAKMTNSIQASIALMGSMVPDEVEHGEALKLVSCAVHPSGVLLLDEASRKYLGDDGSLNEFEGFGQRRAVRFSTAPVDGGEDWIDMDRLDVVPAPLADERTDDNDDNDFGGNDDADGYDYGDADDADVGADQEDQEAPQEEQRHVRFSTIEPRSAPAAAIDTHDPWAPLDPYDASHSVVRPFRKGRSYTVRKRGGAKKKQADANMDGVDDPAFKERFLLNANRSQWSTWVWNAVDDRALEKMFRRKYCKAPCVMTSCDALWRLETKWKRMVKRSKAAEAQSAEALLLQEQADMDAEAEAESAPMPMEQDAWNDATHAFQDETNDVTADLNDAGGDQDDDDDDGDTGVDFGDGEDAWGTIDQDQDESASLAVLARAPQLHETTADMTGEHAQSYEDLCRQHLEAFLQGTEQYVRETDLTRRINDWEVKLQPILREQNQRPPFDIQRYGKDILGQLSARSDPVVARRRRKRAEPTESDQDEDDNNDADAAVPFEELVGGLEGFEVCRIFLASLQLANNGNVQLQHGTTTLEQCREPLQMRLLTTTNAYESLQHA